MKGKFICTGNDLVSTPLHCLNEIRWLNRVNGGHEFRTKETVLFERLFLP